MEAVPELTIFPSSPRRSRALLLLVVIWASIQVLGCQSEEDFMSKSDPRDQAAELARAWASSLGAPDRTLDAQNDLSLGETGVHFEPNSGLLCGRAWVNMARTSEAPAERLAAYRRMLTALNDPRIGGMYDRAGGQFVLDLQRQGFFLVRCFNVGRTERAEFVKHMSELQTVSGKWTLEWFLDVAMIMHGEEQAPSKPVSIYD